MIDAILLLPNAHRDVGLEATKKVAEALSARGKTVYVSPFLSDDLPQIWDPSLRVIPLEDGLKKADLIVTLGGDGTILQFSRFAAGTGIPVIGVNMGNKGFMAELERSELMRLLDVADGNFTVQARMMLDVELYRKGKPVYASRALNEAVVRSLVSLIRVEAYGDGKEILDFSGDGIIVSSPTGSTAYSMAAGGPIVEPDAHCIILTPICTFRLAARSFVLTEDRDVIVRLTDQGDKEVMLTVDGVSVPFRHGDELRVRRSKDSLLMAKISDRSFYDIVFEKLSDKN